VHKIIGCLLLGGFLTCCGCASLAQSILYGYTEHYDCVKRCEKRYGFARTDCVAQCDEKYGKLPKDVASEIEKGALPR
jgi:hypothetical protein